MKNKNQKVIKRILDRKNGKTDNYKIGLIFEGGGMKGQFSSGAAIGLERLGLRDCFDFIYGSSSGSCAAAYFASGNIEKASQVYYKYLSGFRFIKPWRISKLIDIDYLCDEIFRKKVKLNLSRFRNAKSIVKVYVCDSETAKPYCFTNRDSVDHYELIKASCAVPGYYNKVVEVGGIKALDGNAAKKLPLEEAITDGCTDIFIVSTAFEKKRETRHSWYWFFGKPLMRKLHKGFKENYLKEIGKYNHCLDIIFGIKPLHKKVNIYVISPDFELSSAQVWTKKLMRIEQMGINNINEAFGGIK